MSKVTKVHDLEQDIVAPASVRACHIKHLLTAPHLLAWHTSYDQDVKGDDQGIKTVLKANKIFDQRHHSRKRNT